MIIKHHFLPCVTFPDWSFCSVQYVHLVGELVGWLIGRSVGWLAGYLVN